MKTNTTLWLIVALVIVVAGILFFLGNNTPIKQAETKTQSASVLTADPLLYDFGEIDIFGGKVTAEFLLTNEGADDIAITDGTTSCACTEGEIGGIGFGMHQNMSKDFIIPAGETKPLTVVYDPLAHGLSGVGLAQRSVYLKTDSSSTPEIEVRIKALVTNTN